jgi:hypothetical protein
MALPMFERENLLTAMPLTSILVITIIPEVAGPSDPIKEPNAHSFVENARVGQMLVQLDLKSQPAGRCRDLRSVSLLDRVIISIADQVAADACWIVPGTGSWVNPTARVPIKINQLGWLILPELERGTVHQGMMIDD